LLTGTFLGLLLFVWALESASPTPEFAEACCNLKYRQAVSLLTQHCSEAGFLQLAAFAKISDSSENYIN
jgi:hypothetical protein